MIRLEMKNCQNDINREVAKISALSTRKTNKHDYVTGEEIVPFNDIQITEQANFEYSPWGKAFEKEKEKTGWCYKISRPF